MIIDELLKLLGCGLWDAPPPIKPRLRLSADSSWFYRLLLENEAGSFNYLVSSMSMSFVTEQNSTLSDTKLR